VAAAGGVVLSGSAVIIHVIEIDWERWGFGGIPGLRPKGKALEKAMQRSRRWLRKPMIYIGYWHS
jgi:hypothetical protein